MKRSPQVHGIRTVATLNEKVEKQQVSAYTGRL